MEIEIKAKCTDYGLVEKNLSKLNAKLKKESRQIDDYYNTQNRDLRKTNEYLRLRHSFGENKGTFAYHVNLADGVNDETEVDISDVEKFRKILKAFGFEILGTIDKHRKKFILGEFEVTLDDVKDVGSFIEIEGKGTEKDVERVKKECLELLEKLGVPRANQCNVWLCDIATGKVKL